jgi:hypothetical protein
MHNSQAPVQRNPARARQPGQKRRGNVLVLASFLMIVMLAMCAFAVDVGYICLMRGELQRAVDAAALAGAAELQYGVPEAQEKAKEYLVRNPVGSSVSVISETWSLEDALEDFDEHHLDGLTLEAGSWDPTTRTFTPTDELPSSLHVAMEYSNLPFFFGRVLGQDVFTVRGESTAMFQPREMMVVLDYSASMNDDSEFSSFARLGQSEVEANLADIWGDLGSPTYGNLGFTPNWATVHGVPENGGAQIPHITVQYRYSSVYVTSTVSITQVKLEFSGGAQQTFTYTGTTGTFAGTSSNAGKQITKVWVKSWNNALTFGSNGEYFNFTSTNMNTIMKSALGLNSVAFPYPSGTWDAYIDWCESSSNQNKNAGYRYKFGMMNFLVWRLEVYPGVAQTPNLWQGSAEPITALKFGVDVFMDFISAVDTNDRVGLATYNAPDGEGQVEIDLTDNYDPIVASVAAKQAGHFHQYTNIGGGLHSARVHLDNEARPNASKMIVLMTDGVANWKNNTYSESIARQYVLDEAALCADSSRKYKIMAISLGAGADTALMDQVASMTGGRHFNVPGGSSQEDYYQQLYDAFLEIARARPLQIVE